MKISAPARLHLSNFEFFNFFIVFTQIGEIVFKIESNHLYILDGAMGTEIENRGYDTSSIIWSAQILFENPSLVQEIHEEYFNAGADIVITNTFRTSPYSFEKAGFKLDSFRKYMFKAIDIAVKARDKSNTKGLIFGSIASLEDCFRPDLVPEEKILELFHQKTLDSMGESKDLDLILFETQNNFREIQIISKLVSKIDVPTGLSLTLNNKGDMLDGTSWSKVIKLVKQSNFSIFGVNCSSPTVITQGLQKLIRISELDIPIIAYANIGLPDPITQQINNDVNENNYLIEAEKWKNLGASIIGSCCGSNSSVTHNLSHGLKI